MKGPHKGGRGRWLGDQVHGAAGRLADLCALMGGVGGRCLQTHRVPEEQRPGAWPRAGVDTKRPTAGERGCARGSLAGPALPAVVCGGAAEKSRAVNGIQLNSGRSSHPCSGSRANPNRINDFAVNREIRKKDRAVGTTLVAAIQC